MAMKISQAMPGFEGLTVASVTTHTGAGSQKFSFAETIGDSLASRLVPDGAEQSAERDGRLGKSAIAAGKQDGPVLKSSVSPQSLEARLKTIRDSKSSEASMATVETRRDPGSGTSTLQTPIVHDQEFKEASAETEPALKLQPVDSLGAATEATANQSQHSSQTVQVPAMQDEIGPKENDKHAKASGVSPSKSKQMGDLPGHKDKRKPEDSLATGQDSQQISQIAAPATPQPFVATDPLLASGVLHSVAADGSSRSASIRGKETGGPVGQPATVDALRKNQGFQDSPKTSDASRGMTSAAMEKLGESSPGGGKSIVDAAAKADAGAQGSSSRETGSASQQAAFQQTPAGNVLAIQTHASAMLSPERIVSAAQAHTAALPHNDAATSQTVIGFAPGEHGTVTATATALEVGLPGGSHGWLKVRAELGRDGSVHASMSSNSAAGTEALQREVPQLSSYLHQEQVRVSSVVVHATQSSTELSSQMFSDSRGQGMNSGSPDANRGNSGSGNPASHSGTGMHQTIPSPDADGDLLLPRALGSAGGWLSVRA